MGRRQTAVYSGGAMDGAGAMPTVAVMHASVEALLATLNASATVAVAILLPAAEVEPMPRLTLGMTIEGAEDELVAEDVYLVRRTLFGGVEAVIAERAMGIEWVCGATAIAAGLGAESGHKSAKSVVLTPTDLLEARTGKAPAAVAQDPASVEVYDLGEADAIVRIVKLPVADPADGMRPLHQLWR